MSALPDFDPVGWPPEPPSLRDRLVAIERATVDGISDGMALAVTHPASRGDAARIGNMLDLIHDVAVHTLALLDRVDPPPQPDDGGPF